MSPATSTTWKTWTSRLWRSWGSCGVRSMRGRECLTTQAEGITAADFFHVDTITGRRLHAPAFLEHGTRRLHITGITAHPTAQWTIQQARNQIAGLGTRVESLRFILRDLGSKYTDSSSSVRRTCQVAVPRGSSRVIGGSVGVGMGGPNRTARATEGANTAVSGAERLSTDRKAAPTTGSPG